MFEIEIDEKSLRKIEEGLSKMENSARRAFAELFPNLDYDNDFSENINFSDIEQLFEIVERAVDEEGYERYGALHQLMEWTLEGLYLSPAQHEEFIKRRNKFMLEPKTASDFPRKAVVRFSKMKKSARKAFKKIFPNLDYDKDFLQNKNISDIEQMFEIVEKAVKKRRNEHYSDLYELLDWTLEALIAEDFRQDSFKIVRSLDKENKEEFLKWMERQGFSHEDIQNPEIQAEAIWSFFSETLFKEEK